jgi:putative hydrolase of HD superfamily
MDTVKFIHEVGSLKLTPRSGWLKLGIKLPESVAEHSFRTAIIAFLIAYEETGDVNTAYKASTAALFHDLHETRTTDLHKIAKSYAKVDEKRAFEEQLAFLNLELDFSDVEIFVIDADKLELAFQAVEYSKINSDALQFSQNLEFSTKTAEKIYENLMQRKDPKWWK